FGRDPDNAAAQKLDVLILAVKSRLDYGRIGCSVPLGHLSFPDGLASFLIEGNHRSLAATRRDDESIAVNQRRLAVSPAGHHAAMKIVDQVLSPMLFTAVDIEAHQVAANSQRIEEGAIRCRSATWPLAIADLMIGFGNPSVPDLLSRCLFECPNHF